MRLRNYGSSAVLKVALVAVALAVSGCAKKVKHDETELPGGATSSDENKLGDSDSGNSYGLETVHFGYDSDELGQPAEAALASDTKILKEKSKIHIQIEGYCDQRGGIQYNIALGEKRANAVMRYLEKHGVAKERLNTVSYGKERLLDSADNEAAYAKNRRANLVITSLSGGK